MENLAFFLAALCKIVHLEIQRLRQEKIAGTGKDLDLFGLQISKISYTDSLPESSREAPEG